jgi:predicted phosphodiesterase
MTDLKTLLRIIDRKKVTPEQLDALVDNIQHPKMDDENYHVHKWGASHIKIGLFGDTHIGSKHSNYKVLNDLFKRFKSEGVEAVYHTGDITEGYGRRKGHSFECELHGSDEQVKGVIDRMPDINKNIHFITGDHDGWHYESSGVDIGKQIEMQRSDMKFLGSFQSTIEFTKGCKMMLMHPATGTAYAISYKPQKIIESLSGGEKPNILAIGHFHKIEYLFYRNIHCFQTGTTENQTPWMARMNLSAHLGGWILDIHTKKNGSIDKLTQTLLPYY